MPARSKPHSSPVATAWSWNTSQSFKGIVKKRVGMMMLKYKIAAAVSVRAVAAGAASAAVVREIPARTRAVPAKPMMVSAILHAPALPSAHSPANGPVHIKTIGSAHQAAQLARRDRLVLEHLPLVKAIANRVRGSVPVHVDQDDLVHAGILGLFDAANKFNLEKQVVFSSYAKYRIRGAILDSLRQLDWASA